MTKSNMKSNPSQVKGVRNKTTTQGVGKDRCVVKTTRTSSLGTVPATGSGTYCLALDPFSTVLTTNAVNAIAGSYEFYRIVSLHLRIIPVGGFTAPGQVAVCFINNPEVAVSALNGAEATRLSILQSEQGYQIMPVSAGGSKTYNPSRVSTRKWYQCNYAYTTSIAEIERASQTTLLMAYTATASAPIPFVWAFDATIEFSGLSKSIANTLLIAGVPYSVPYNSEESGDEFPKEVELFKRNGTRKLYAVIAPTKPTE